MKTFTLSQKANMDHLKDVADIAALSTTAATVLGMLPHIAAVLSIVWTIIRIFEWVEKRIQKRKQKEQENDQQSTTQ